MKQNRTAGCPWFWIGQNPGEVPDEIRERHPGGDEGRGRVKSPTMIQRPEDQLEESGREDPGGVIVTPSGIPEPAEELEPARMDESTSRRSGAASGWRPGGDGA